MTGPFPAHTVASSAFDAPDDDPGTYALDADHVLPTSLARRAREHPRRPFLQDVDGRALDYGQAWDAVLRWCTWLDGLGVRRGDRVVTMLPSSIDATLCWLALGCLGACEVPVNPELRGAFLTHVLRDSGAQRALVRPEFTELAGNGCPEIEVIGVDRNDPRTAAASPASLEHMPSPADPACVIYTSGTTGPAKGAVLSWAQIAGTVGRIPRTWLSSDDAVYAFYPMFHVTGRTPLASMLDCGGRVVTRERLSVSAFWTDIREHRCTTTTAQAALLLSVPDRDDDTDNPLRVVFGAHNVALNARLARRFDVHVVMTYGSTEIGFPLMSRGGRPDLDHQWCGSLRRGYRARVVDDEGRDVPDGTVGELWVGPPHRELAFLEYLGLPEQTVAAFTDGYFRTGDAVIRFPDGEFVFVDRLRDTIRRNGENISSAALEAAVLTDSEVARCAAIAEPDQVTGQRVVLAVEPEAGTDLDPAALYARLRQILPRHMHPSRIVVCDELPTTAVGKVRKHIVAPLARPDHPRAWSPSAEKPPR